MTNAKDKKYKSIIEVDTAKMRRDGLDVDALIRNLEHEILEIESYSLDSHFDEESYHLCIGTDIWGHSVVALNAFVYAPWFMKYVIKWDVNDNGMHSDGIETQRELGKRCSYA